MLLLTPSILLVSLLSQNSNVQPPVVRTPKRQTPVTLEKSIHAKFGDMQLSLDVNDGRFSVRWGGEASFDGATSTYRGPDGVLVSPKDYTDHQVAGASWRPLKDELGQGEQIVVQHRATGKPDLRQIFSIYQGRPEVFVQVELGSPTSVGTNYIAPISLRGPIRIPHTNPLQSLFVPFDNDNYFRYRSDAWGEAGGSYEVGAVYDDGGRQGIVVGSVDHDTWKSAIEFRKADGEVSGLTAYAGATSKYTHDVQPHGVVSGKTVRSPRMVIGWYGDWRTGMERFGDLNAKVKPALPWKDGVPFGWNSWAGHKAKVNATVAKAATDFIHDEIPTFRNDGTAYINFDSFWDNLGKDQRAEFVKHAHSLGLKAGIYYTPFNCWGGLQSRIAGDREHTYRDIVLKDEKGEPLPKIDGAYPIDPTNPAALARIDRQFQEFIDLGFDFVKLDFMTHGSVEGKHFDPKVQTGIQAYNMGLQRIVDDLSEKRVGRPFFISFSIAPLFPSGYAHSRRVSCDVFANIGATEYLLNSSNYGWWTGGRLYKFNDPDHTCVYQPMDEQPTTEGEARCRFTGSIVTGGMLLEGDDLTKPEARARAKAMFSNKEVVALARRARPFRPVSGDTGSKGGDTFVLFENKGSAYVAVFNFNAASANRTISLDRLGLPNGNWKIHDLWTGQDTKSTGNPTFNIPGKDCILVHLTR